MSAYFESGARIAVPPENAVRSSPATESGHLTTVEKAGSANRSLIALHVSRPQEAI